MLLDRHARPLGNLRLSVTDRCNLRCQYCMPEEDYRWLPKDDILQFEEIDRLVDGFLELGADRIRLTGGEPLLRRDLGTLVERLSHKPRVRDLAMTTNGVLLAAAAPELRRAGLHRLTVSLDTLQRDRFVGLARFDKLDDVLAGIDTATPLFPGLKIDTVVIRGVNDDELVPMLAFARERSAEVRFIEYMDVGGATRWQLDQVVTRAQMLQTLAAHYGPITAAGPRSSAPADRFTLEDGTVFGIIASTTEPFCASCDRSRLTADGMYYLCLYATEGIDLRGLLRRGASDEALRAAIAAAWSQRSDRGAELRLATRDHATLIPLTALKRDPHLEMHTRGG